MDTTSGIAGRGDDGDVIVRGARGGLYDLPLVGRPARATRSFYDDMAPRDDDSAGVRAGKQVLRYGTVAAAAVAGGAVAAIVVL